MSEEFRLKEKSEVLRPQLADRFAGLDQRSDAGDLHRVLEELRGAGILECPEKLEVVVYPDSVEDGDIALITVLSTANPNAHVVAASEEIRELATSELWEGDDSAALTLEIVESAIGLANGAAPAVRHLEELFGRQRGEAT